MINIDQLKSELDLVTVLKQRGLELVPRGSNLFTTCPFHEDGEPSLSVNPKSQLWSCFGCGAGGDVFTFIQKQDSIGFVEAVRRLCKKDIQPKDIEDLNRERQENTPSPVDRLRLSSAYHARISG